MQNPGTPSSLTRYGVALGSIAAAIFLRWLLDPLLGTNLAFLTLYGGVAVAVWFSGWIPATVAAILGFLVSAYLFHPPGRFAIDDPMTWAALGGYALSCWLIIYLGENVRRGRVALADRAGLLVAAERRLNVAMSAGRMGAWEWHVATGRVVWSPGTEQIHGLAPGTFGGSFDDYRRDVHPDDLDAVVAAIQSALSGDEDYHVTYRIRRPDGATRWLEAFGRVETGADGKPNKMAGVCMDVTERKESEDALRESQERLRVALRAEAALNEVLERRVAERTAELDRRAVQLRALAAEITRAEQRERRRVAEVLHDSLQQILVGMRMHVVALRDRVRKRETVDAVARLDEMLTECLAVSRNLVGQLSPLVLYDVGLLPALGSLARRMEEDHGLHVEMAADAAAEPDDVPTREFVYAALRELMFNVVKHAQVKHVRVSGSRGGDGVCRFEIADAGVGFDPDAGPERNRAGFGLFSIHERAQVLGGRLEVESSPGRGARMILSVPARQADVVPVSTSPSAAL